MASVQRVLLRATDPWRSVGMGSSGAAVTASGAAVYYRSTTPVDATTNDGTLNPGDPAVTLQGNVWFATSADRADLQILQNDPSNGVGSTSVPTRRSMLSVSSCYQGNTQSLTEATIRQAIQPPLATRRWRLRIRNYDSNNETALTTGASFTATYIGQQAVDANGAETANTVAAPVAAVLPFTLPADGTEYVSEWVTDSTLQLSPDKAYILSMGMTGGSTQATGHGAQWRKTGAGSSTSVSSQTDAAWSSAPTVNAVFDLRVEYEYVGNQANYLVIGDSTSESGGSNPISPRMRWPERYGRVHRVALANGGVASSKISTWNDSTRWKFQRMNPSECQYDAAVILLGINDITASASLATLKTTMATLVAQVAALGITRVYFGTITPNESVNVHGVMLASARIGDTTISLQNGNVSNTQQIRVGAGATQETATVSGTPTGGPPNPYVVTLTAGLTRAHAAGEVVTYNYENQRLDWNDYLRTLPYNALGCFSMDVAVSSPFDTSSWDPRWTADHLHPTVAGHERMASAPRLPSSFTTS